jgi:predicted SprT family Zn-dependent metalloprotease
MDNQGKGMFCTVRLSFKILQFRSFDNMLETLLHELIHAFLFLTKTKYARNDGVDGHGPDFISKMVEINQATDLRLSVYHSFHDEVALAQNHVWMCDGKCGNQPPFYGIVKRARNAPPTEQDFWFAKHKKVCGGSFVKVLEPAA